MSKTSCFCENVHEPYLGDTDGKLFCISCWRVRALEAKAKFDKLMSRLQVTHDAHRIGLDNREMCVCPLCVEYRRARDE